MNAPPDQMFSDALTSQLVQHTNFHVNLGQDAIIITEDKVRLCLMTHLNRVEDRRQWIAPAGILATLLVVFPTTTFNDFWGLKAAVWQAIAVVSAILTFAWLVKSGFKALNAKTLDDVIGEMKRASTQRS
jgi:hypothetical protein